MLRASGDESEASVSFAIVDQLLRSAGAAHVDVFGADQHLTVGMELLERLGATHGRRRRGRRRAPRRSPIRCARCCSARAGCSESATLFVLVVRGSAPDALPEGWLKLADGAILRPRPLTPDDARVARRAARRDR